MKQTITLNPVTRIEGHLAVKVEVDANLVSAAYVSGEMFRGFEAILRGRDPLDAQHITQRICGVCPVEHGMASVIAQEMAYGLTPPDNGRIVRNLIQGANFIMSHLTHFYLLSAVDFVDVAMVASYSGKDPALLELHPGTRRNWRQRGSFPARRSCRGTRRSILRPKGEFHALRHYLDAWKCGCSLKDGRGVRRQTAPRRHASARRVIGKSSALKIANTAPCRAVARVHYKPTPDSPRWRARSRLNSAWDWGCGDFLSYASFPNPPMAPRDCCARGARQTAPCIRFPSVHPEEEGSRGSFRLGPGNRTTANGSAPNKAGAYTWLKAPRSNGQAKEVGPLARMLVLTGRENPA